MGRHTNAAKMLLASIKLRQEEGEPFTAEDLVVWSWKEYPDTFGLAGYSKSYPDSNRILTNIMGSKGMRGKGWIRKVGEKKYKVTSKGVKRAKNIAQEQGDHQTESELRGELDRESAEKLESILDTRASSKILDDDLDSLTFHDTCGFWEITPRSDAKTLEDRLLETRENLEHARKTLSDKGADRHKVSGHLVTEKMLEKLLDAHHEMQSMFEDQLDILRERTDQR
jgi:hypothetical protein